MRNASSTYRFLLIALLFLFPVYLSGQYLENPSFEGEILMIGPPNAWDICIEGSTPNVQPGKYNVYVPPSDGNTYIGMFTRQEGTWEDIQADFLVPLSKDSCYIFKIDLAYQQTLTYNSVDPIMLRVYGDDVKCEKQNILWQSPIIDNTDWITFEFLVHNEDFDITDLVLEAIFNNQNYPTWGYILIDNIRIEPTPLIDLGNDTTIVECDGGTGFDLEAGEGFAQYLWQDGSNGETFYVDTTGVYWVQVTTSEGCTASDSIEVVFEEYEEMQIVTSGDIEICLGMSISIGLDVSFGSPPYVFEWDGIPDVNDTIIVSPDTTTTFYVTITDNCDGAMTDSIKVTVLPLPEIDLGNDTILCGSDTLMLHAGGGFYSYFWQDNSTDSTYTVTENGTYWVQVTNENGCAAADEIDVSFFPPVEVNIGNDTIICLGDSIILDPGNGYLDIEWQDGSTNQTFEVFETGFYVVMLTDINGCEGIDSIYVEVDDTPTVVDLGNDTILCGGQTYLIDPGFYNQYIWQDGTTASVYNVTEAGTYSVNVLGDCNWATDSITIGYFPPVQVDIGSDTNICFGQSLQLDAGFGFISVEWQDGSTSSTYNVYESGLYFVEVEDVNSCLGSDTIMVEVASEVDLGADTSFCEGETLDLDAGFGYDIYSWNSGSNGRFENIAETGFYWVDVGYTFGCPSSDTVYVELMELPVCDIGDENNLCEGDTLVLHGPEGVFEYYWNGVQGGPNLIVAHGGTYQLLLMNSCGDDSDEVEIIEYHLPEVDLGEDILLFPGDEVQVNAGEFASYLWQDGANGQYYLVSYDNCPDSLEVEVFDGYCKNTDIINVEVYNVEVPLVITPNGDGYNDSFLPIGDFTGIKENKMIVYNRWGEKVWESSDFLSGWDGKSNGKFVSGGTYFWVLEVKYGTENLSRIYKGSLTVLGTE
ncbi:MAG: gliding motility-associated C-terminal domain-containing protein [Chlorobi bacterium]|nr:gliding motility-associated C-terminal domain-containing protein [Chlorobiota bacterium]